MIFTSEQWDDEPGFRGSNELARVSYCTLERRVLRVLGRTIWRGRSRLVCENILGWWADPSTRVKYESMVS
jgi:hypothetical protein